MKNSKNISTSEKIFFYVAIGCLIFLPFRIIFTKNFVPYEKLSIIVTAVAMILCIVEYLKKEKRNSWCAV